MSAALFRKRRGWCILYVVNKTVLKFFAVMFFCALAGAPLAAQSGAGFLLPSGETGDPVIAERYVLWAEQELAAGRRAKALAGLERGADYAEVSADLLYLLAHTRKDAGLPAYTVLAPCAAALENGRWKRYTAAQCRILQAETFIMIRQYDRALEALDRGDETRAPAALSSAPAGGRGMQESRRLPENEETTRLRLLCRMGLGHDREFVLLMKEALNRYPRDTRLVRIFFDFCEKQSFAADILVDMTNLVLRRLPLLVETDPELAYIAAPFIPGRQEASRYVAAYRAAGQPNPASIPEALALGLLDDDQAVAELFTFLPQADLSREISARAPLERTLDKDLVLKVWRLLRAEEGRAALRRNLLGYTGVIKEDTDKDGIFEARTEYKEGQLLSYTYDADQDGRAELTVRFSAGVPSQAEISAAGEFVSGPETVFLRWERYPAVLHADFEGTRYIPRPGDFSFTPLRFAELVAGGPLYPVRDGYDTVLTGRSLFSFSVMTERESAEFSGAVERTFIQDNLPVSSVTYFDGKLVAEKDFLAGRPVLERVDTDQDGSMETIRRFSRDEYGLVISSESDWDGDGVYEYAEILQGDGTVKKYWDLDGDGVRETER